MLTCFFKGCRGDGSLTKVKRLDLDTLNSWKHDCKASSPILVLLGRVATRAAGCHCTESQS